MSGIFWNKAEEGAPAPAASCQVGYVEVGHMSVL